MSSIQFGGHHFEPQDCGALFWPSQSILIVSDLHFEKGSHYAQKGQFLPPYDTHATLQKIQETIERLIPQKLLFLGDVFHDEQGKDRLDEGAQKMFHDMMHTQEIIWIDGNHDKGAAPDYINVLTDIIIEGIAFTHISDPTQKLPEMSGHYHPCASLKYKGSRIRKPCFLYDEKKLIMPAYGAFTGGLDYDHEVIKGVIPNPNIFIVGMKRPL